jgi:predicted TIM-barrel fold metal-dependent hydrolase
MIIDSDGHLFEPPDMWATHMPASQRDLALSVQADELGYPVLHHGGVPTSTIVHVTVPGDFAAQGKVEADRRAGLPNSGLRLDDVPATYWEPSARAQATRDWGIDLSVLFPQTGFIWEYILEHDPESTKVNMAAWNRWAVEVTQDGGGRLQPVGHVTLQGDITWLAEQLATLERGGVRLAMFSPMLVNGKRMSHPDHDAIWQLFVDHNVTPAWHVNFRMASVFDNYAAWTDNDTDSFLKVVTGIFQPVSVQMGLADLAANGVFARFPDLNIVIAEVGTHWLPSLLRRLDNLYRIHGLVHGRPLTPELEMTPSEYIRRQVLNVCSFPTDAEASLLAEAPDNFAFGADYPHPEGLAVPLDDYKSLLGDVDDSLSERFYGANMARVLQLAYA